jgi:3-hydroxybutyrate dehydrogenase
MSTGRRGGVHARNILITGAGSGIGAGLAVYLADSGHRVVVTDCDGATAGAVAYGIQAAGGRSHAAPLDVTNAGSCWLTSCSSVPRT